MGEVGRAVASVWERHPVYPKTVPPNNAFAFETHKCILTIEDSQEKNFKECRMESTTEMRQR